MRFKVPGFGSREPARDSRGFSSRPVPPARSRRPGEIGGEEEMPFGVLPPRRETREPSWSEPIIEVNEGPLVPKVPTVSPEELRERLTPPPIPELLDEAGSPELAQAMETGSLTEHLVSRLARDQELDSHYDVAPPELETDDELLEEAEVPAAERKLDFEYIPFEIPPDPRKAFYDAPPPALVEDGEPVDSYVAEEFPIEDEDVVGVGAYATPEPECDEEPIPEPEPPSINAAQIAERLTDALATQEPVESAPEPEPVAAMHAEPAMASAQIAPEPASEPSPPPAPVAAVIAEATAAIEVPPPPPPVVEEPGMSPPPVPGQAVAAVETDAQVEPVVDLAAENLQGLALEEELSTVTDDLWAFKRYLEQYRERLTRELDEKIQVVAAQLGEMEETSARLQHEWSVEMNAENRLAMLEKSEPGFQDITATLRVARERQTQILTLTENLATIIQRYSDLLEKVALLEGNLKRFMKAVDGTARSRMRQTTKQDFLGSSAIIRSQEMERQRIAREIHDGPAQAIANVILRIQLVEKMLQSRPEMVNTEFSKMKEIAQGALNEIRGFIFDLRPMTLQDLGLTATLKKIVQNNQSPNEINVELVVEGEEQKMRAEEELAIFRIAQEALTNVKKHAKARHAYVHLKYLPGEVVLIVEDDGSGFEPRKGSDGAYTHYGLIGMQERADDIEGDLQVISQQGRGTKVIFTLPLTPRG